MRISIIVPVYNEIEIIKRLNDQLKRFESQAEIIVVDGGSTDGTREALITRAKVIQSSIGRAKQMNAGAAYATGDVLLFLHGDSVLPNNAMDEIRRIIRGGFQWGCFSIAFDSSNWLMKYCAYLSNLRVRKRSIVFGDQGFFIKKDVFQQVGGYSEIPIMEDYALSLALRKLSKPGQTKEKLTTSARRFEAGGIIKTVCRMQYLQYLYRKGVHPIELSKKYEKLPW